MVFGGRFGDHILPEKTRELNVAFLIDRLEQRRGGTATNIAFSMALLGERPLLCAAAGAADFGDYAAALEAEGVDISGVLHCEGIGTATAFITTDADGNQITAFYPGAMTRAAGVDLSGLRDVSEVVVGADDAAAMALHIEQADALGARLVFAPAQQIPAMPDDVLRRGLEQAWLVSGNDYELEMIRERTGLSIGDLSRGRMVAVTRGSAGSEIHTPDGTHHDSTGGHRGRGRPHGCGRRVHRGSGHGPARRRLGGRRRADGIARGFIRGRAARPAAPPLQPRVLQRALCGLVRRQPHVSV